MGSSRYRDDLPQRRELLLTDGGLETTLVFDQGMDLPDFASFPLLDDDAGRATLLAYFATYVDIARRGGVGIVLETPTWRANADWGARLGYDADALDRVNRAGVALLEDVRAAAPDVTVVISGDVGPRGDGYVPGELMSIEAAAEYHGAQIATFTDTAADLTTMLTANYVEEAAGFVLAARDAGLPAVASFTVETDGTLPSGASLAEAIRAVDEVTDGYALSFGINCAHPDHFQSVLAGDWVERIGLLRANASRMSHAELDEAEELDAGDPDELAASYRALRDAYPSIHVIGGCCGTDHRHVGAIATACTT